jgi:hypothetical protein
MVIKRVGPLSFAKVTGTLYASLGVLIGAVISIISLAGGFASGKPGGAVFGAFLGVGAVIVCPIIYGGLGFLMTLIGAALYNLIAGSVGGVQIDVE